MLSFAQRKRYSEGLWTPDVTFVGPGTFSRVSTTFEGIYTKIGNIVFVEANVVFTPTFGTASGNFRITGLPFTLRAGTIAGLSIRAINSAFVWPASRTQLSIVPVAGTTQLQIHGTGTGVDSLAFGTSNLTGGVIHALGISGVYGAAA